ncbi:MAG: TonB-dependent receptor [Acidobacteriota bacterium]
MRPSGSAYSTNNLFIPGGSDNLDKDSFYNLVTKFDFNITDKHHVFFREASNDRTEHRNTNGALKAGFQGPDPLKRINDAYVLDWTGTLNPTLIVGARGSFARYVEGSRSDDNIGVPLTSLGFPASLSSQLPQSNLFGQYNFTNYTGLGSNVYNFNFTNTKSASLTLTKVAGSHTLKAGVDLRWIDYNVVNYGNAFLLTFDNTWTQQVYNKADSASGNSFASALLGLPASGSVDNLIFPAYLDRYYAGYVQDDWKVNKKLTVNLGLRWDFIYAPTERYSRLARGFDPNATSPIDAQLNRAAFPGFPTLKGGLLYAASGQTTGNLDKTGIQPRIGFAYQVAQKIVVRGGFGRYMINPNNDNLRTDGYSITTSLINSPDGGRTPGSNLLTNPYPAGVLKGPGSSLGLATLAGQSISFFNPTFKTPYTNQMNFGFQMQLPLNSKLDISYVGNFGHKLQTDRQYNEPTLAKRQSCDAFEGGAAAPCNALVSNPFYGNPLFAGNSLGSNTTTSNWQLSRPFPQFGTINELGRNDGKSWYDALQVNYGIRATKGWNLTFGYTFSKTIEQGGFDGSNGNNANQAFMDVQRFIPERSIAGFDHPHVLKISSVYELPFGRGRQFLSGIGKWTDALIGGWQHTMILQYSSGLPWNLPGNVVYVKNAAVDTNWHSALVQGVNPCIAKMSDTGTIALQPFSAGVAGCTLTSYNFLELPTYAPARGAPLRTGDIRLAATPQVDMSVGKTFKFTERMSFQFRVEAFNVFNSFWPNTQQFANNPDAATFGQIILGSTGQGSANFPRQVQLGFKFIF